MPVEPSLSSWACRLRFQCQSRMPAACAACKASGIASLLAGRFFGRDFLGRDFLGRALLAAQGDDDAVQRVDLAFGRRHAVADRKSVVSGKRVSVRVDLGGGRILKKKTIQGCKRLSGMCIGSD